MTDKIVVERTWRKSGANLTDQHRIRKLHGEGASVVEIAKLMDIDPNAVNNWVEHFDKGGPVGPNVKEGVEVNKPKPKKKEAKKAKPATKAETPKAKEDDSWDD